LLLLREDGLRAPGPVATGGLVMIYYAPCVFFIIIAAANGFLRIDLGVPLAAGESIVTVACFLIPPMIYF